MLVPRRCVANGARLMLLLLPLALLRFPCEASSEQQIEPLATASDFEPLPNFDLRLLRRTESTVSVERKKSLITSSAPASEIVLKWDEQIDLPHHLLSLGAGLTHPSTDDAVLIAKRFVTDNRALYSITGAQLDSARVSARESSDGMTRLALEQQVNGLRVFDGDMLFMLDAEGRIVSESGSFVPEVDQIATAASPVISAEAALDRAVSLCGGSLTAPVSAHRSSGRSQVRFESDEIDRRSEASLLYYPVTRSELRLAYQVLLYGVPTALDAYLMLIDAGTGELLRRDSLTFALNPPMARVFVAESPAVAPQREMVALAGDSSASPSGWVREAATAGNNAQVFYNPNLMGGSLISAAADGNFDFPLDLTPGYSPLNSYSASGANLFYWVNYAHDRFHVLGFNEANRNFQADNFGKGGRDGDPVRADTLRGARLDPSETSSLVRNNAYFQTTLDGMQPLLAMLMWTVTVNGQSVDIDSSYDAGVIIHEYTHGVSTRLSGTDTSVGLRSNQGGGMGEGWSDFFAMSFLHGPSLLLSSSAATGSYVTQRSRGVRSYPYSTSFAVNPLTFGDIACNTEVHAQGTVWCTMLWELRQAMTERYGFDAGRTATERLVINGLKATPLSPTFVDARDAILLADRTTNAGANQDLIWRAFARRGLGKSATTQLAAPGAGLRIAVTEAYDVPPEVSAGFLAINDKPSPAVIGESVPVIVVDRDLISAATVDVVARNLRSGQSARVTLTRTTPGRFAGDVRIGSSGGGVSAEPGDEISIAYANARNEAGVADTAEVRMVAGRRVTLYETDVERDPADWKLTSLWHQTARRASSGSHSLYFAKQKGDNEAKSNTPIGSSGAAYSPLIDLQGLVSPRLEFDYFFSGTLQGDPDTPGGDLLGITLRNYPFFGASLLGADDPQLAIAYDLRPQNDGKFHAHSIDLRFLGTQYACLSLMFNASLADVKRKKLEGFYIDNVRVTAVSSR